MNIILFERIPEGKIPLSDFRAEHIAKVLRLSTGDAFRIGETGGEAGIATISAIDSDFIHFDYRPTEPDAGEQRPLTLTVAQVRPICMKRILREAASFGVRLIILTGAETSEKSYQNSNLYKTGEYKDFLLDGAMQSGCTAVPEVLFASSVKEAVKLAEEDNLVLLDNVENDGPLSRFEPKKGTVNLAIGPERGWTDNERRLFREAGFKSLSLGNRILRTETACSAGTALMLSRMGIL